jgi:hypothetical protein
MLVHARGSCRSIGALLMLWGTLAAGRAQGFAGGTGEPNDPYQLATAEQLVSIGSDAKLLNKHFVLVADIDLDPNLPGGRAFERAVIAFNPINSVAFVGTTFTGSLDGHGHMIANLTIRGGRNGHYLGLFGVLGERAVVKNLGMPNVAIGDVDGDGGWYRGALAAQNRGRVIGCHAEGHVSGWCAIGGLVGSNWMEVMNCHASGEVFGAWDVGGLVGASGHTVLNSHATSRIVAVSEQYINGGGLVGRNTGYIANCYATGDIFGQNCGFLGGLVGYQEYSGVIAGCYAVGNIRVEGQGYALGGLIGGMIGTALINCYATGDVSGGDKSNYLGGLAGVTSFGTITHCYATGKISSGKNSKSVGGLVGEEVDRGNVKASFWDIQASGLTQSAGGTVATAVEMQDVRMFREAGWDLVDERANGTADVWSMPKTSGYLTLAHSSEVFNARRLEGSGTADDPYRIATAEDIGAIWYHEPWACYRLTRDIHLTGVTWACAPIPDFYGSFDGGGFIVSGLTIRGMSGLGLFGCLRRDAVVMNLGIKDADIADDGPISECGALAGYSEGKIAKCYATGVISAAGRGSSIGGLVGRNGTVSWAGKVNDCYAIVNIRGGDASQNVGGLVGNNVVGVLANCYSAGTVSVGAKSACVGGLAGEQFRDGKSVNCYFLASLDGNVGFTNDIGLSLTGEQMERQASFLSWDFDKVWMICEGKDYPRLQWERVQSQP